MSTTEQTDLTNVRVADSEHWREGAPLELFQQLRNQCPVHWSSGMTSFPDELGFWSVTNQELIHEVSRNWQLYSSEIGGMLGTPWIQLEVQNGRFIGMDPPKHGRLKTLFQRGFTPKGIEQHEGSATSSVHASTPSRAGRPSSSSQSSPLPSRRASSGASWASTRPTTRCGRGS